MALDTPERIDRALKTAEAVGYYFGLQRAGNMKLSIPRGDAETIALNDIRRQIDAEMKKVEDELPPGTIDQWPRANGQLGK